MPVFRAPLHHYWSRAQAAVVLRDPNVSRRHAEMTYDGHVLAILLICTINGTLVNDIDEVILRDGAPQYWSYGISQFREN